MSSERAGDRPRQIAPLRQHVFADGAALARGLAERVAFQLEAALRTRGRALLAVSGGSTPKRFFAELSVVDINWSAVDITLADERWLPAADERSNARLLREHLQVNAAAAARLMPLHIDGLTPESGALLLEQDFIGLLPIDVLVLGMGSDGHTASLFPGGDQLDAALDPAGARVLMPMHAPGAPEPRITFTLPALASARHLHLHIEGAAKQAVLREALAHGALPIAKVLGASAQPVDVWTCA
jgi:6-phosphogluconolactonase